jgi:hypothetical protein
MDKVREQIAKVIGQELPWREVDLLEFADKIVKLIPRMTGEDIDKVLPKKRTRIEHYLCESGNCTGCWEEEINNVIDDCKQALLNHFEEEN